MQPWAGTEIPLQIAERQKQVKIQSLDNLLIQMCHTSIDTAFVYLQFAKGCRRTGFDFVVSAVLQEAAA